MTFFTEIRKDDTMDLLPKNIDTFADTQQLCDLSPTLKTSIDQTKAKQEIISGDQELIYPALLNLLYATTQNYSSVVDCIKDYEEETVLIHMISTSSPGKFPVMKPVDDVTANSCLFPCLVGMKKDFFDTHDKLVSPYNDDCIYSPSVYFIKNNGRLIRMPEWKKINVISVALPDDLEGENKAVIASRLKRMLEIAKMKRNQNVVINTLEGVDLEDVYKEVFDRYQNDFLRIDFIK